MSQQTIFDEMKQQLDKDFGKRTMTEPKPKMARVPTHEKSVVFYEGWKAYRGETADWLREIPTPVDDTQIASYSRVSKTLNFQGRRIHRSPAKPVPSDVDAIGWLQTKLDRIGGCAEAYNASGQVVMKFTPKHLQAGRAFI